MSAKVKVCAGNDTGVINVSANPEYGYVRLEQVKKTVDEQGFLKKKPFSTLLKGKIEDLQGENFIAGQELQGCIQVVESITPFSSKEPEKDLKLAGSTGIVCSIEGNPIYRKTVYRMDPTVKDITLRHDNVEEIREAQRAQAAVAKETEGQFKL